MKAITICQPYAHMICVTQEKRVENRSWPTRYRGEILIHAGKSREWLTSDNFGVPLMDMQFGAIIGKANLVLCARIGVIETGLYDDAFPWLRNHEHTKGPFCWVLTEMIAFKKPVEYRGAQGIFNIPDSLVLAGAIS